MWWFFYRIFKFDRPVPRRQHSIFPLAPRRFEQNFRLAIFKLILVINTLRLRQNGTFKHIFLTENIIAMKISLNFIPSGQIINNPALVQIMAWRRPGAKPLSEPVMVSLLMLICVTWPQWVNGWSIFCEIVLMWRSLDLTEDKSTWVQVMAWCCQATSHYLNPMLTKFCDALWHY